MDNMLLHPHTKKSVLQFTRQPSSVLLLIGSNGIGKTFLAKKLAENLLQLYTGGLDSYPYFLLIQAEKSSISIDKIRGLRHSLRLTTTGKLPIRRAVIVEHADLMTIEAQNALLKLLEEPPIDTVIIMTVVNQQSLLPTVVSRVQAIEVYPPNKEECKQFFAKSNVSVQEVERSYFLSGGLPGLMSALLTSNSDHPLVLGVATAKDILAKQTFERLSLVDSMSKNKEESQYVLEALQSIAGVGIRQATEKQDVLKLKQWHHILKQVTRANYELVQSGNTKLVLSNLMLNL